MHIKIVFAKKKLKEKRERKRNKDFFKTLLCNLLKRDANFFIYLHKYILYFLPIFFYTRS